MAFTQHTISGNLLNAVGLPYRANTVKVSATPRTSTGAIADDTAARFGTIDAAVPASGVLDLRLADGPWRIVIAPTGHDTDSRARFQTITFTPTITDDTTWGVLIKEATDNGELTPSVVAELRAADADLQAQIDAGGGGDGAGPVESTRVKGKALLNSNLINYGPDGVATLDQLLNSLFSRRSLPTDAGDGQYARYDASTGLWVATDPPSGGGGGSAFAPTYFSASAGGSPYAYATVTANQFGTIPLNADTNVGGGTWDSSAYTWEVPASGRFLIVARARIAYGATARNVGLGVHTSNADGPFFAWRNQGGIERDTFLYQRIDSFAAGDKLRFYLYSDGTDYGVASASLSIDRIA